MSPEASNPGTFGVGAATGAGISPSRLVFASGAAGAASVLVVGPSVLPPP
ncbi:Uncharacterised protein [Mycobacteroides abscessus subsp. abscessus]|nr:Uncharacterised protein [Mycobacteroides abscessus subsp. abscessus]